MTNTTEVKKDILKEFVEVFKIKGSNDYVMDYEWMLDPGTKWKYLENFLEVALDRMEKAARAEEREAQYKSVRKYRATQTAQGNCRTCGRPAYQSAHRRSYRER